MRKIIVCLFILASIFILSCKSTEQNVNELDAVKQELQKEEDLTVFEKTLARYKKEYEERKQKQEEKEKRISQLHKTIASERGYTSFDEFIAKNSIPYDKFERAIETRTLSTFPLEEGNIILMPTRSAVVIQESDMLLTIHTDNLRSFKGFINSQTVGIYEATDMFFLETDKQLKSRYNSIGEELEEFDEDRFLPESHTIHFYDIKNPCMETVVGEAFYMEYIGKRNTGAGRRAAVRPVFKYIAPAIDPMGY